MSANDILFQYQSAGASQTTAWPQSKRLKDKKIVGVEASEALAKEDLPRLKPYAALFLAAAQAHHVPPALLAAIASRESRGGAALTDDGWGDNYNGFGLMQVDKQNHPKGGPYSGAHVLQAARILKDAIAEVKKKHPGWPAAQQLRGGVAAYNFGASNVWTIAGMDQKTTGDDYSSDVWARARFLAPDFGGTGTSAVAVVPVVVQAPSPSSTTAGAPKTKSLPVVHELQSLLIRHGYMTPEEVRTGPGLLGPRTRAAVARFLKDKSKPSPAPTVPAPATPSVGNSAGAVAQGVSVNANDPVLKTLATGTLKTGQDHSCVRTTLNNMARLGIKDIPAATGGDKNNSRGALVQMLRNGHWDSLPLEGSWSRTIKSPYGTVVAHVLDGGAYKKLALAGRIPSGAIIFQTKHGWDYGVAPYGNDMGIVRDGGRVTFNYAKMPPIVYGAATKEVVLLLPKSALGGEAVARAS